MRGSIVLCADEESLRHPELLGLEGESLPAQPWLRVFSSAAEARNYLKSGGEACEVWVASCDDVEPINAAAAMKRDDQRRAVRLVAFDGSGSLKSRASQAGVEVLASGRGLAARYAEEKRLHAAEATAELPKVELPKTTASAPAPSTVSRPVLAASESHAFMLPVVSGSGGAGKSTVAVLAALLAQQLGFRTLLVDLDLQFGDMAPLLGMADPLRIDEAMLAPERALQLAPQGSVPALLAAPLRLERGEAVADRIPLLLDALSGAFDVVVANTGSLWAEQHAAVLERSSKALFLVDQRPSSLRACRHAVELCSRCGIATSPFLFAVNRCSKGSLYTSIDVSCALHGAQAIELRNGGPEVEELLSAGLPLDLLASRNELCVSLEQVLMGLLPGCEEKAVPAPKRKPRMFFAQRGKHSAKGRAACLC